MEWNTLPSLFSLHTCLFLHLNIIHLWKWKKRTGTNQRTLQGAEVHALPRAFRMITEHVLLVTATASWALVALWFDFWSLWYTGIIHGNKSKLTSFSCHYRQHTFRQFWIEISQLCKIASSTFLEKQAEEFGRCFIWLPAFRELHKRLLSSMITWCDWIHIRFAILWEKWSLELSLD